MKTIGYFELVSPYQPAGDQPKAIAALTEGLREGKKTQTLLGVTGSGKTFTLANVIKNVGRPTLVISHNKTLAAQLYAEFKEFFPHNAVEYFVSYYDYYQPEAYIPQTDTYIEKDSAINDRLDRLRLAATTALVSRRDVIIVASVSCIYNIGSPDEYRDFVLYLQKGMTISPRELSKKLIAMQYERSEAEWKRGVFRIKGDTLDVYVAYDQIAYRIEFFGDEIEAIREIDPVSCKTQMTYEQVGIYPAKHFVVSQDRLNAAYVSIEDELSGWLPTLKSQSKDLEAHRLEKRTMYDLEMMRECGSCKGIENYSRHLSGREAGSRPYSLLEYFPEDYLMIIDESHVTVPQIRGMFNGDQARKNTLVEFGFRLPSCLDNRPLKFTEFEELMRQTIFVSATPGPYEQGRTRHGDVVEQIIRPTGLVDPQIEVRATDGQIPDIIAEAQKRVDANQRVIVTTLTKRMAEDLTAYLKERGISVAYLHSDIKTIDRAKIIQDLRKNVYDVLIGVNLLREGIDLPEVSLVVILDADKEGFLRSETSLIQVAGRAARNVDGKVIMYADTQTDSMRAAIRECERRRCVQKAYNAEHGITPKTVQKAIKDGIEIYAAEQEKAEEIVRFAVRETKEEYEIKGRIEELHKRMIIEAKHLNFEKAAAIRDTIRELEEKLLE